MKIILSTNNPSKAEQIKAMFKDSSISIFTLSDAGIEGGGIEDGWYDSRGKCIEESNVCT